jgi:hypothetical protein
MLDAKQLKHIIDEYKDVALSDEDMLELVKGRANIVVYPNMHKFHNINEIIKPYDACFILYESRPHFGHWCCLSLNGLELEFFDPYGGLPDSQLKFIPEGFKIESKQDEPYLSTLLYDCDYDISYNQYQFQKFDKGVKDCGRWCAIRVLLKEMSLKNFKELFFDIYSDDIATLITIPNVPTIAESYDPYRGGEEFSPRDLEIIKEENSNI